MKGWIERFSRLEDAESDVGEFTHHGADDELGRLALGSEVFAEASAPFGFVESDHGGHVERAAQEGMADLGEARPAADAAAARQTPAGRVGRDARLGPRLVWRDGWLA